ncbi:MAG: hypothetical protein J6L92_05205 [Clostridia bacterium]|nr:hypothetical protein [Clostridia bacterium]
MRKIVLIVAFAAMLMISACSQATPTATQTPQSTPTPTLTPAVTPTPDDSVVTADKLAWVSTASSIEHSGGIVKGAYWTNLEPSYNVEALPDEFESKAWYDDEYRGTFYGPVVINADQFDGAYLTGDKWYVMTFACDAKHAIEVYSCTGASYEGGKLTLTFDVEWILRDEPVDMAIYNKPDWMLTVEIDGNDIDGDINEVEIVFNDTKTIPRG